MKSFINLWLFVTVITIAVIATWAAAPPVTQCPNENFENLQDKIQITPCGKKQCKLPKNSNITVVFKFTPKNEVKTLSNEVYAEIGGIPLPFLGVTGTDACGQVLVSETGAPATCPLAAGREYEYTNVFPVLSFYPAVNLIVHWHLHDHGEKVICFEVPATITPPKKS